MNPDQTASHLHLKNGLTLRMLLESYPNQEGIEEHLLTGIWHLNLLPRISAAFKFYFIKEFQRLKEDENTRL